MLPYVIAPLVILAIALAWIGVQYITRRYARRHPEFGPWREPRGCGLGCTCDEPCEERKKNEAARN